jgi:hypothetical protein
VGRLRKVTDELSAEARAMMHRGFAAGDSALVIAHSILSETRERVAERTIARRREEWRAERDRRAAARERMQDLLAAAEERGMQVSDAIVALARERLEEDPDALTSEKPAKLQQLALQAEELRLKARQLDLRERTVAVVETQLKLATERAKKADAQAAELEERAKKGEAITAEQIAAIRGIYGLRGTDGNAAA